VDFYGNYSFRYLRQKRLHFWSYSHHPFYLQRGALSIKHDLQTRPSEGDADLLRFAAWVEVVESDLWTQYNELGGATKPNDGPPNAGNPPYIAALQNLDGDMPQYISDNTDDELSHAAFLNAYLLSKGAEPVDLDPIS